MPRDWKMLGFGGMTSALTWTYAERFCGPVSGVVTIAVTFAIPELLLRKIVRASPAEFDVEFPGLTAPMVVDQTTFAPAYRWFSANTRTYIGSARLSLVRPGLGKMVKLTGFFSTLRETEVEERPAEEAVRFVCPKVLE